MQFCIKLHQWGCCFLKKFSIYQIRSIFLTCLYYQKNVDLWFSWIWSKTKLHTLRGCISEWGNHHTFFYLTNIFKLFNGNIKRIIAWFFFWCCNKPHTIIFFSYYGQPIESNFICNKPYSMLDGLLQYHESWNGMYWNIMDYDAGVYCSITGHSMGFIATPWAMTWNLLQYHGPRCGFHWTLIWHGIWFITESLAMGWGVLQDHRPWHNDYCNNMGNCMGFILA